MPWLTPDSIPEEDDCRPLFIPASSVWLALVSGALTELTLKYNWEKFGALTVDETVAKMQEIVDGYYNTTCLNCMFPDGGAVIRIDSTGHLQQLGSDGTWQSPTGDYIIPAPSARTGGTSTDQICLASKNAVNVLHELYLSLSDSFSSHLTEAEALVAFIAALIALVGFEFAPITTAIAIFFFAVFEVLYRALSYLTADLWTDDLTNQLVCFLLECATNTAGVVTYDWDCFIGKLNSLTDTFGLSEVQLRFYLQISYILYFMGGVDGLNLAARTTAITSGTCDGCAPWCYEWDFTVDDGGWTARSDTGFTVGHYSAGIGWVSDQHEDGCSGHAYLYIQRNISGGADNISHVEYTYGSTQNPGGTGYFDQNNGTSIVQRTNMPTPSANQSAADMTPVSITDIDHIWNNCGQSGGFTLTKVRVTGEGAMPAFAGGAVC